MIFRRPLLTFLSSLVLVLTSTLTARAETESHSPTDHAAPSAVTHRASSASEHGIAPENHPTSATEHIATEGRTGVTEEAKPHGPAGEKAVGEEETKSTNSAQLVEDAHREIVGLQNLGVSLTDRGDWDAGEIAFRQILASPRAKKSDLSNALLGLARVYRRQGSFTKAAAVYERYLKDYPTDIFVPDALLELGRTQRALGAPQLALSHFYNVINSTIKISSENSDHYQVLAKTAQFEIAETHFQQGNFIEANKFYSRLRLLDLAPADRARAHFKSADALYRGNDFDGAVKTLTSYLDQWPQDENVPEARYLLSLSLRSLGRKQEALDATLALLRTEQSSKEPKKWSYWQRRTGNQLANDFFQSGDTLNALMIYQGLNALSTDAEWRFPVAYQMGLCFERMRLYDRASTAYQTIVDGAKTNAASESGNSKKGPEIAPNAELAELARMAAWRLGQLNWHDQTERQLAAVFTNGQEPAPKAQPGSHTILPNIDTNVSSQPTPTPGNDHSGNAAKTSASL
jgi:tetratricopeptide (TPR) repeat protein